MLVVDETAPSYRKMRPLRDPSSPAFPVYQDLTETLVKVRAHPDDTVAHPMAACAG